MDDVPNILMLSLDEMSHHRKPIRSTLTLLAFLVIFGGVGHLGAEAGDRGDENQLFDRAEELARKAAYTVQGVVEQLLEAIPYEWPEVNEEGDIIIRRKRKAVEQPDEGEPAPR